MQKKFLHQGAEAKLYLLDGRVVKERIQKNYRIPELDRDIRKKTTRAEIRMLTKASTIINVPKIVSASEKDAVIEMEYIKGKKLRDVLDSMGDEERKETLMQVGQMIAKLHNANLIHGDLTTSNMILKGKEVFFIDFGLGFFSTKEEDKAVDIYLLKQALKSKHHTHWRRSFKEVTDAYCQNMENAPTVMRRLDKVESRGRYKKRKS